MAFLWTRTITALHCQIIRYLQLLLKELNNAFILKYLQEGFV